MTDPVVQPRSGGTPPPPGAPSFPPPDAGGPGFPSQPGVPGSGVPGSGVPASGGPFPGAPFPGAPESKPKKKVLAKVLGVLGVLVIFAIVVAIKIGIGGALAEDPTAGAKAGDCIGIKSEMSEAATEVEAEIVGCSTAAAKYTVLGRVEGVKDVKSPACDATFDEQLKEGEEGFVIGSQDGAGYLLCLKAKA